MKKKITKRMGGRGEVGRVIKSQHHILAREKRKKIKNLLASYFLCAVYIKYSSFFKIKIPFPSLSIRSF